MQLSFLRRLMQTHISEGAGRGNIPLKFTLPAATYGSLCMALYDFRKPACAVEAWKLCEFTHPLDR